MRSRPAAKAVIACLLVLAMSVRAEDALQASEAEGQNSTAVAPSPSAPEAAEPPSPSPAAPVIDEPPASNPVVGGGDTPASPEHVVPPLTVPPADAERFPLNETDPYTDSEDLYGPLNDDEFENINIAAFQPSHFLTFLVEAGGSEEFYLDGVDSPGELVRGNFFITEGGNHRLHFRVRVFDDAVLPIPRCGGSQLHARCVDHVTFRRGSL